jgi:hypothetical protein
MRNQQYVNRSTNWRILGPEKELTYKMIAVVLPSMNRRDRNNGFIVIARIPYLILANHFPHFLQITLGEDQPHISLFQEEIKQSTKNQHKETYQR